MKTTTTRPTSTDQQVAQVSLPILTKALAEGGLNAVSLQSKSRTVSISIPEKALDLLAVILSNMAQGKVISLIPSDSELSTQQAADMLNVSRPHLVKLLEEGLIPFKKVGSHRRVVLEDLLHYEAHQKAIRQEKLQFLAAQAQALNLGYE